MRAQPNPTHTYVVPLSLLGYFDEQAALNNFIRQGYISHFSAWWNKTQLLTLVRQFSIGSITPAEFKSECQSLFPALGQLPEVDFFQIWREHCTLTDKILERLENLADFAKAGHTVRIVGNVDEQQSRAFVELLGGFGFKFPTDDFSCFKRASGEGLIKAVLADTKENNLIYFSPPTVSAQYERLGILKWLLAPFESFFCARKRAEIEDFWRVLEDQRPIVIPVEMEGDLKHEEQHAAFDSAEPLAWQYQYQSTSRAPYIASPTSLKGCPQSFSLDPYSSRNPGKK